MDALVTKMEEEKERKKVLQVMVEKRKRNADYFKRLHNQLQQPTTGAAPTPMHWMNVVMLTPADFGEDIQRRYVERKHRRER